MNHQFWKSSLVSNERKRKIRSHKQSYSTDFDFIGPQHAMSMRSVWMEIVKTLFFFAHYFNMFKHIQTHSVCANVKSNRKWQNCVMQRVRITSISSRVPISLFGICTLQIILYTCLPAWMLAYVHSYVPLNRTEINFHMVGHWRTHILVLNAT